MSKSIFSLIPDIYHLVQNEKDWFHEEMSNALAHSISTKLHSHFNTPRGTPGSSYLRMSALGPKCPRALWYSINHPEMAEALPPWAEVKFAYGYVLESLAITLARAAGHEVTGEQDELLLDGIVGHRDCVVDGVVVDFKSCSSIAFSKFKNKTLGQDDSFGYLDQLSGYVVASANDPLVRVKDRGYFVAIDKTLGHMVLYEHIVEDPSQIRYRIKSYKDVVKLDQPPTCECGTRSYGIAGNVVLDTRASYSPYKYQCFPGLKTFLYSKGPVFFSKVVKRPEDSIKEINREGKTIFK